MSDDEKKLEKIIEVKYRKSNEPLDIARLVAIAEKLEKIESENKKEDEKTVAQHVN